jgi:hypothetical protein
MANRVNKSVFNRLKKLALKERMQVANSPAGASMLGLLTPTQFAELFPKYWQRGMPDVGGFRDAISKKSQQKQQDILTGLAHAGGGKSGTVDEAEQIGRQIRQGSTRGSRPSAVTPGGAPRTEISQTNFTSDALKARKSAEGYLGRSMTDQEWNDLVNATHAEAGGNQTEVGMVSASILNRARIKGKSITAVLNEPNQFQAVTGTKYAPGPSKNYTQGPGSGKRSDSIFGAIENITPKVSKSQTDFTSNDPRAYGKGTNPNYLKQGTVVGQSRFNTAPPDSVVSGATPSQRGGQAGATPPSSQAAKGSVADNVVEGMEYAYRNTSATKNAQNFKGVVFHVTGTQSIQDQTAFQKKTGYGYHYVIDKDGKVYQMASHGDRPNQIRGAGAPERTGRFDLTNNNALGVGFITGGGKPTQAQMDAAHRIMPGLYKTHGIPTYNEDGTPNFPIGHGELQGKDPTRNALGPGGTPEGKVMAERFRTDEYWKDMNSRMKNITPSSVTAPSAGTAPPPPPLEDRTLGSFIKSGTGKATEPTAVSDVKVTPVPMQTATVQKPSGPQAGTFDVNQEAFLAKIRELDWRANMASAETIREGFNSDPRVKAAGFHIDKNWKGHANDVNNSDFKDATKDFGGGIISPAKERRSEIDANQSASLSSAEFLRRRESAKVSTNYTDTSKLTQYAALDTGTMTDASGFGLQQRIGHASAKYESGNRGVHSISSGRGDRGGVSYGAHQLSSRSGTMSEFLNSPEGAAYKGRFGSHRPGSKAFSNAYSQLAKEDPHGFEEAQHAFIRRTHYEPLRAKAEKLGYNVEHPRVQEALYSMSVQHRRAANRLLNAPRALSSINRDADAQVNALFDVREAKYSKYRNRYEQERKDILAVAEPIQPSIQTAQAQTPVGPSSPATPVSATIPQPQGPQEPPSAMQKIQRELFPGGGGQAQAATVAPPRPAPSTPTATPTPVTGTPPSPTPPPTVATPPGEASTSNFLRSQGIPGASDGGSFGVNGDVSFYPMDKRDNVAAVDTKTQQPLFTARGGERIDVTPAQKVNGAMGPTNDMMRTEFDAIRQELDSLTSAGQAPKAEMKQITEPRNDMPNFIGDLVRQNKSTPFQSPSFRRAVYRSQFGEDASRDPTNNYTFGNTNA